MPRKARRQFTTAQKASILRRHFVDKVAISDLCAEYELQPSVFYYWQNQVFENLGGALQPAVVGESAIVAAQSFVKAGLDIPPRMLAGGVPAKVMRELTELEMAWKIEGTSVYHDLVRRCHGTLREVEALKAKLTKKDSVIAEISEEYVVLKKTFGGT